MSAADRSYRILLVAALGMSGVLLLPLVTTLFPAEIQNALHRLEPFVALCAGLLEKMRIDLPPLGVAILALASLALASAVSRTGQLVFRTERARRMYRTGAPPARLLRAAARVGIEREVRYVPGSRPFAHCIGLLSPVVVISDGALRRLRDAELEAVLWHEAEHLRKRDPLRVLLARALAALFVALPLIEWLALRFEVAKELDADRAAIRKVGDAAPLAAALLALGPQPRGPILAVGAWSPTAARVDQLLGVPAASLMPRPARRVLPLTVLSLALALALALGQGIRAHAIDVTLGHGDRPTGGADCPLPPEGILL